MNHSLSTSPLRLKHLLILAVAAYILAVGIRLTEAPEWDSPDYQIDGEYILATHDSYHWLAGAKGFEFGQDHPMSLFLRGVHALTGEPLGNIGLWLPPFAASLVAVAMVIWAAALGARCSGIAAALLACLAPGFLARTLMGFCDTDLVTLLFSLMVGLAPALWLRPWVVSPVARLRQRASGAVHYADGDARLEQLLSKPWLIALALCGLFGHWTRQWHSLFSYLPLWYAVFVPGCILLFVPRRSGTWPFLLRGAPVYILPLLFGIWGLLAAFALALALRSSKKEIKAFLWQRRGVVAVYGLLGLLFIALCVDKGILPALLRVVNSYVKHAPDSAMPSAELVYPAVAQSVIEIQDLKGFKELLSYFYPTWQISVLGILGFAVLSVFSPLALCHAPLLLLALLSIKLGGRMAMFGVPAVALGLAVPFAWLSDQVLFFGVFSFLRRHFKANLGKLRAVLWNIPWADAILLILILPYISLIPRVSQGPIMRVEQARALRELGNITPENGVIWVWWDFGYATQYFAERRTIADGARHGGAHLYLPAAVYSTENPHFAAQLMTYTALHALPEAAEQEITADESQPSTPERAGRIFAGLNGEEAQALVESWAEGDLQPTSDMDPQYLLVSFDILRLGYWISTYGTWNFVAHEGAGYNISAISKALKYNSENGIVSVEGRDPVEADSLDILDREGLTRHSYYRYNDRHFIFNKISGDKLVLSDGLYNALMTQMLLSPADDPRFSRGFELVFDNGYCRVYKIK